MGPRKKKWWAYLAREKERGVEAQTASATQRGTMDLLRGRKKKGPSEEDKVNDPELLLVAGTTEAA